MKSCFSDEEARRQLGCLVEAVSELPSVPRGTRGRVVRVFEKAGQGWFVCVQWNLPRNTSLFFALLGDISFNFPWRSRIPIGEFSKLEFEQLLKPLESDHSNTTH